MVGQSGIWTTIGYVSEVIKCQKRGGSTAKFMTHIVRSTLLTHLKTTLTKFTVYHQQFLQKARGKALIFHYSLNHHNVKFGDAPNVESSTQACVAMQVDFHTCFNDK